MHNSYNQFLIPQFFCLLYIFRTKLVVHHQEHDIIYVLHCTIGTIVQASLAALKQLDSPARLYKLCNTVYYVVFLMMKDCFLSKHVQQTKKTVELKIDYKNCASR